MTAGAVLYEDFRALQIPCVGGTNHWVVDVVHPEVSAGFASYTQYIWKCCLSQRLDKMGLHALPLQVIVSPQISIVEHRTVE